MQVAANATTGPRRNPNVTSVVIDGEAVLYAPGDGEMFRLDALGTLLWQLFDGSVSVEDLAEDVAAEFRLPTEQASADIATFVGDLRERRLLLPA